MRCIKRAMRWYMTKQILMRWAKTARTAKGSSSFLDLTSQCASQNDERKIEQAAQSRARNAKTITSMLKAQSSKKVKESLKQTIEDGSKLVLNKWAKKKASVQPGEAKDAEQSASDNGTATCTVVRRAASNRCFESDAATDGSERHGLSSGSGDVTDGAAKMTPMDACRDEFDRKLDTLKASVDEKLGNIQVLLLKLVSERPSTTTATGEVARLGQRDGAGRRRRARSMSTFEGREKSKHAHTHTHHAGLTIGSIGPFQTEGLFIHS
jgi:hypothetical protein